MSHEDESVDREPQPTVYGELSISVLALLMPASVFGVLARLGIQALATYDGQAIFSLAYVQAVGCLFMGFFLHFKSTFFERFHPPLYTALTSGFCGSLTTFSGWQLDVFSSWVNAGQFHRGGLRDFIDGVGKITLTMSISLASVAFGKYLGRLAEPWSRIPSPPAPKIVLVMNTLSVVLYLMTILTYFLLSPSYRHQATAALLFSFPGTLTRYIFSLALNKRSEAFPFGTFTANIFGTALLGAFHALQSTNNSVGSVACTILQGLSDGYCGCLTTVSTFASEILAQRPKEAWRYGFCSIATAQMILVVILGPSYWAGNVHEQRTCLFE